MDAASRDIVQGWSQSVASLISVPGNEDAGLQMPYRIFIDLFFSYLSSVDFALKKRVERFVFNFERSRMYMYWLRILWICLAVVGPGGSLRETSPPNAMVGLTTKLIPALRIMFRLPLWARQPAFKPTIEDSSWEVR